MRQVRDQFLPPDHQAFVAAEPPTGRVIVIAPTRAACETIELASDLHIETVLEQQHGKDIRELAIARKGFGIVAGTGTGKTLSIRPISEEILRTKELRVGVVNREREATPETPTWNVIIVTTGIARRWFQDGDILATDTLIVDEIHQTSAELELCLALGKRVGCRFIWLSATVDPTFYANYLDAAAVLQSSAFDPAKAADVKVIRKDPQEFLDDRFLLKIIKEKRGVGMFLPTRAGVEEAAESVASAFPRINTAYYHGGEPIRIIRPFLEGGERKPYFLAMTAAGQSALNVKGLDTVVIDDTRFGNIIERGKNVLTRMHLGANEILQMAGRVHGRVEGGRVFILSDRDIQFATLKPTAPEFQLAGDSERVAMTCADLGVDADRARASGSARSHRLPRAIALLEGRGIIEKGKALDCTEIGRSAACRPTVGRAARQCRRRDDSVRSGGELDRVAASHDAGRARPARDTRRGKRPPHRVQSLRRGVHDDAATWAKCMAFRAISSAKKSRLGGAPRRSREGDRRRRARHGERVSRPWSRSPIATADRARSHSQEIRRAARAVHAVRSRDR